MAMELAAPTKLAHGLALSGQLISFTDLRDVLWLASHIRTVSAPLGTWAQETGVHRTQSEAGSHAENEAGSDAELPAPTTGLPEPMYAKVSDGPNGDGSAASAVRVNGVPPLPNASALAQALRPLMRRQQRRDGLLDGAAIAQRWAETGFPSAQWAPRFERWHDLTLVVEIVPTLAAWRPVAQAFEKMLRRQSGLRSIQVLTISRDTTAPGEIMVLQDARAKSVDPKSLHDAEGRRLVLMLSDCTSKAWRNGLMGQWLGSLARHSRVSITQLLPEALWPKTAIGFAEFRVRWGAANAAGSALAVRRPAWADGEAGQVLPVLGLESTSVRSWANMMAGRGQAWSAGVLLTPEPDEEMDASQPRTDQRVQGFAASASAEAMRLAGYLAQVRPLTPAVMRLIHRAMFPHGSPVALAQVLLGGLLEPGAIGPAARAAADDCPYEFHPGLRDRLALTISTAEVMDVYRAMHQHLKAKTRCDFEFTALLRDDQGTEHLPAEARPFAWQMAKVAAQRGVLPPPNSEVLQAGLADLMPGVENPVKVLGDRADQAPQTGRRQRSAAKPPRPELSGGDSVQRPAPSGVRRPKVTASDRVVPRRPPVATTSRRAAGGFEYRYSVYMSYAHDDDVAWGGWVSLFNDEVNRTLPARLRDLDLPESFMSSRNGPIHGDLQDRFYQAIESSFAMVVFVHDAYLRSKWCLEELRYFRDLHGEDECRRRVFFVAMSQRAIERLSRRPEWRELFPSSDSVWLSFHQRPEQRPNHPIGMYLSDPQGTAAVMSTDFLQPFFRLRESLVEVIHDEADLNPDLFKAKPQPDALAWATSTTPVPKSRQAPYALVYIESAPGQENYSEPLGLQITQAWESVAKGDAELPSLKLRLTALPLHNLRNRSRLDDADGVILLWGEKTPESLLAQIQLVEPKLSPPMIAPCLIAYLGNGDAGPAEQVPLSIRGWPVVRFASRRDDPALTGVATEDAPRLAQFLADVLSRKRRLGE